MQIRIVFRLTGVLLVTWAGVLPAVFAQTQPPATPIHEHPAPAPAEPFYDLRTG